MNLLSPRRSTARPAGEFPALRLRAAASGISFRGGDLRSSSKGNAAVSEPLLPRIAAGDADAVQACLDRYGGLVWALARRLSSTQTDAEDAVQEIFIDVWESAARFNSEIASETTFIAMIARRRLIDRRRKQSRRPDESTLNEAVGVPTPPEQARVELDDEASIAADALTRLPNDQRQVLTLSIYNGMSHSEIAERLAMPLGTVKTHARRGLIRVREMLRASRPATTEVAS